MDFSQAYGRDTYLRFLAEKFSFSKSIMPLSIPSAEVKQLAQLGFITTGDNKELPVFEAYINPDTQLSRNRVGLRNVVLKQIKSKTNDGAFAVYIDKDNSQWRFSFMTIEPHFKNGNIDLVKTASKRFTYLLGKNTQTRTAIQRFDRLNKQSTLQDLKDAFAVEPLTKDFYEKLFKWYREAEKTVVFPNDENTDNHTQTSLIRLITRLLFVWFLKQKRLINSDLFDQAKLENIINWHKPSSFYKAILQNLFFATLNRPITERSLRKTTNGKANNTNYLVTNVYRYQSYFVDQDQLQIIKLFAHTPFLNGGLFECLDREATDEEKQQYDQDSGVRAVRSAVRIEGFSDHKDNTLSINNDLFFSEDETNLGLIDLFKQYQFTATESTPADIEVALDPELLGKVFENLLASYNPETKTQARKATGSYYTPREIVDYMVDESLKQYLYQQVRPDDNDREFYWQRLDDLFTNVDKFGRLNTKADGLSVIYDAEIAKLIKALSEIKILDPAVGSGAFPMGLLQRITSLLAILDPDNSHFKGLQLAKAAQIPENTSKKAAMDAIEEVFSPANKYNNYGRKLYLIEKSIYGVDIQPIAIQICKLRFFISLTIEQTTNDDKNDNYGIKALPNLETNFIIANTLLPLGKISHSGQMDWLQSRIEELYQQLAKVRHKHFSAKTKTTKNKYRKEDKKIRAQMLEQLGNTSKDIKQKMQKVANWDLYNPNAIADWFDPKWQFGVSAGFDIVIGNPPYIRQEAIKKLKPQLKQHYSVFTGTADIYTYFYEKGITLFGDNGHLCYITSNKWMRARYGQKLRRFFKKSTQLKQIIDFKGKQIFENATVDTNILLCGGVINKNSNFYYQHQLPDDNHKLFTMAIADLTDNVYTLVPADVLAIKKKIEQIGTPLKDWDVNIYRGVLTGFNEAFIIDTAKRDKLIAQDPKSAEIIKPILRGRDIKAYEAKWAGLWLINVHNGGRSTEAISIDNYPAIKQHLGQYYPQLKKRCDQGRTPYNLRDCAYLAEFSKEKIVYPIISGEPRFTLNNNSYYTNDKCFLITGNINLQFLTAVLNSKLSFWYLRQIGSLLGSGGFEFRKIYVEQLPIPKISKSAQQPFIDIVDKILIAKGQNQDTTKLEAQIDNMVYQLYNISANEIAIIEGKK